MEINKDLIAASSTPIVLAILAEEDSYGYAILQRVRELSEGRMEWTDGMLYPVLHRLERLGYVEARWEVAETGRRRKYYGITAGPDAAGRGTQAVAGGGRHAAGHLAGRLAPAHSTGAVRATATGSLTMSTPEHEASLEEQIDQWRSYLRRRQAIHSVDVAELEDHLREQIAALTDAGLAADEAFLVAVKRMGGLDALAGVRARALGPPLEAARAVPRRWRRVAGGGADGRHRRLRPRGGGGARHQAAGALRGGYGTDAGFYGRNLSFFVLPLLTGYFAWKRGLDRGTLRWLAVAFVAAAIFANVYTFGADSSTETSPSCTCPSRSGWWWGSRTPATAGGRWRGGWTSSASRASCSSTTS
jgi:hypothetical protein